VSRGLNPSDLGLVIFDEYRGLQSAVVEVLGDVPRRLCWAHRCRNMRQAVRAGDRRSAIEGLREA
jgi:transposase-like protein